MVRGTEPLPRLPLEGGQLGITTGTGGLADSGEQETVAARHHTGTVGPIQEILVYYLMRVQVVRATTSCDQSAPGEDVSDSGEH